MVTEQEEPQDPCDMECDHCVYKIFAVNNVDFVTWLEARNRREGKESLKDLFDKQLKKRKDVTFKFTVGQKVRILENVIDDGQTPKEYAGAIGVIVQQQVAGIALPEPWYVVGLPTGKYHIISRTCAFREDELDDRYIRKEREK